MPMFSLCKTRDALNKACPRGVTSVYFPDVYSYASKSPLMGLCFIKPSNVERLGLGATSHIRAGAKAGEDLQA